MTTLRSEFGCLLRLSWPVALTQLGFMLTGVVDTLMVSRLGMLELAASALANMWQWSWLAFGMGLVMGMDPLVSQAHGRGDGPASALALQRAVVLTLLVSVLVGSAVLLTKPGLLLLGQQPEVAELAGRYNLAKLPTVPCFLLYTALRQYLQGRTMMAPATWVMWFGNAINVVLNWALIFGHLGLPALGLVGAGIASSFTTLVWAAGLALWIWTFKLHLGAWRAWDRLSFELRGVLQVARLGLPVGAQLSLEASAFTAATLMAGWISTQAVASHQVVLTLAALSFMVPLGVSQGATTRVGNLIGAGDVDGMRRAVLAAICLGALVMVFSALTFTLFRYQLPLLFTTDAAVVALAAQIFPIAGAFQLFDGTQVVAGGVLRGMGRPDAAAWTNLVGYYGIALPIAYLFAFQSGYGLTGIWLALAGGLTLVALSLLAWVRHTAGRPLADLQVAART